MKLYKVWCDLFEYDTYDGVIIVANSEEEVWKLLENQEFVEKNISGCVINFASTPKIKEIKLEEIKEPIILLTSFNAG